MGIISQQYNSESDNDLSDSDSLADEIAPKIKKLDSTADENSAKVKKVHKNKKKHKKHKVKHEKKKHKDDLYDESLEKSHKKHKHKRKKHKKHDSDQESAGESDVPVKRRRMSNDKENGIADDALLNADSSYETKVTSKSSVQPDSHKEEEIAIDDLERQKAILEAALMQSDAVEDGELPAGSEQVENGGKETDDGNSDDNYVSKKKKKKDKSRSGKEKLKKEKPNRKSSPPNDRLSQSKDVKPKTQ